MRIIILDRAHDPDLGYPVYADKRPDLHDQAVWAVADVEESKVPAEWDFDYLAEGLTLEQALQWSGADSVP
jgi:SHS2 domain-containing protein